MRISSWPHLISGLTVLFSALLFPGMVPAQNEGGEKIYQKTLRSTAWVLAPTGTGKMSSGTGSLIDASRRLVLTNYHVVDEHDKVIVLFAMFRKGQLVAEKDAYEEVLRTGGGIPGKVLYREPGKDLAIVQVDRIPAGAQALRLAREGVTPGQQVHSVGNTGRSDGLWLYTPGIVRQVYDKKWRARGERPYEFHAKVIETQSATNPGDSGGPLVNNRGELVGVTQGVATNAQLLSLFIDLSEVKAFLASKKLLAGLPSSLARNDGKPRPGDEGGPGSESPEDRSERLAGSMLRFAKLLASEGKFEKAKQRYEDLIGDYPKTKAASEAKELLEKLNKP